MSFPPVADLIHHPWSSYAELERVYGMIYENRSHSDGICRLKEATNCLTAWSLVKCKTAFRPEISALAAFVNAIAYDRIPDADDLILYSLYTTAMIRFCEVLRNYEFNPQQNRILRTTYIKTGNNRSEHAESIGLPGWVVDIRHDAAHGDRVSLDLMRSATDLAMNWLEVNFWNVVLHEKRIDLQIDGIVDHVFSDAETFASKAKSELYDHLRHNSHSAVKFLVRSLLKATATSDLTLAQVNPKTVHLIEAIVSCGQIHLMLHNLIDYFDSSDKDLRAAAILWFAKIMKGMTTKNEQFSQHLSKYLTPEISRIPEVEIQFMRVLNHLLMCPSEAALQFVPCFKKIIPGRGEMIDRVREALATLLGIGLRRGAVEPDYQFKTAAEIQRQLTSGSAITSNDSIPSKRLKVR
jgi:transcription termination factor NusB